MNSTSGNSIKNKKSCKIAAQSFGPVHNLEEFLQPDWWRRIFNSMYLKTDADVVEDESITGIELDMFTTLMNLSSEDVILDLACGQGRHSLELARRGFKNIYGLDRSHYLVNKAKQICFNEGLSVSFKEGDARKLPYPVDHFDVVMILGNSFGYFESIDDDIQVLNEVLRVLKPHGKFLMDVADGNFLKTNFNPRSWEWMDKNHFVCRERSLSSDNDRMISREVISHTKKGVIVDQFYAERLYSRDKLTEILENAGFRNIRIHDNYTTNSSRNQDLGMMEQRIILSAEVVKDWSPLKKEHAGLTRVVVLLGDPSKTDIVKPDTLFDEDDYITIEELKTALGSLKNYKFTYLDNHDMLINNLIKLRPEIDIVLNLCDEGFNNNPRSELHIPSLLEILNIPYSGSNPQCLAYCYDKSLIRGIAKEMDIPVADALYINPVDNVIELNIEFPVIAKPNFGDSSFGITQKSVAYTVEELNDAIVKTRMRFGYDKPILVEEFLTGKDLSLGIIGNPPESYTILPIIEEDYSQLPEGLPRICGYEAKWLQDSAYFKLLRSIKADLDIETEKKIVSWSLNMTERLECRDYVRFDWRLDENGSPKLLEINPNPGWCWDGHLAKMASLKGFTYATMLQEILIATEQRLGEHLVSNRVKEHTTVSLHTDF